MKALSIRQPWAFLIIAGEKPIENRSWVSNYSGPLLIHASSSFDKAGYQWVKKNFPRLKMPTPAKYELGAIIGSVDMVGCVPYGEDYHSPWFSGPYGFLFRSSKQFDQAIPFKGQLGFFEVPDELLKLYDAA
jgi:hypothetical protein